MRLLPKRYASVDCCGSFLRAAERVAHAFDLGRLAPGKEGLATIARALIQAIDELDALDRALPPPPHLEDDALIEGFGALLGLALAETLGGETLENQNRHGIRFGRYGYFDPFMAVRSTLEADDPRETLAEYLDRASEEACGRGVIALAYRCFADALRAEGIADDFEPMFPTSAVLPSGEIVSLERLAQSSEQAPTIARHLARMLNRNVASLTDEQRATLVYPRLVGERFFEGLGEYRARLYAREFASGLWASLIAHYGDRARFLREDEVPDPELQERLALERLDRSRRELKLEPEGALYHLASRDGLDASRLLLPRLQRELESRIGEIVFVGVPHRDLLLASSDRCVLEAAVESAYQRAPHPISSAVYTLTGDRLARAL